MALSSVTDWIQAISAALGVIGLAFYAPDTRKIREATLAQSDATRRPVLMLTGTSGISKELIVLNVGAGVALNVDWRFFGEETPTKIGSLAVGERREFVIDHRTANYIDLITHAGMRLSCADMAKKRYWTTFEPDRQPDGRYITITHTEPEDSLSWWQRVNAEFNQSNPPDLLS